MTDFNFIVSATQISTFELCPRKWAWRYIDGVESPPNKYAVLGVDTHGHLEDWLRFAKVPVGTDKSVQLAQALIPHLPPPQAVDPNNVELDQYYELCGVKFNLKIDLFMPRWGERPRVFDHKTGSNPEFWLKPEEMPQDVQATIYAGWALHKTLSEQVDLQWNYVCTKGAIKTQPVITTVAGRDIQDRLGRSLESARKMRVIAESGVTAIQVDNEQRVGDACSAFGGCPHLERCGITPRERLSAVIAQGNAKRQAGGSTMGSTEDFLASLAKGPQNGAAQQPLQYAPQAQAPQQQQQQAPLQYAPQGAPQQAPLQYAPAPQQAPQPQYAPQAQPPMQYPTQQAPLVNPPQVQQQAPMALPPQAAPQAPLVQGTVLAAAAPAPAPAAPAAAPVGRPPKVKATDDPWVHFAKAALEQLVAMRAAPQEAAAAAAQYADYMVVELGRRK